MNLHHIKPNFAHINETLNIWREELAVKECIDKLEREFKEGKA